MLVKFWKYQGAGNDFILFDNRSGVIAHDRTEWFNSLCDRRFGIGADGVMLLEQAPGYDFGMVYYNSDGRPGTMCGNGGRCMIAFAGALGMQQGDYRFLAVDGPHAAFVRDGLVHLQMQDVHKIEHTGGHYILDTGSPHYVTFAHDILSMDVKTAGAAIRYLPEFMPRGINVNFLEQDEGALLIRTYERGVEDETLSCGTGVTASALVAAIHHQLPEGEHTLALQTMGGKLQVRFTRTGPTDFTDIWLIGPGTYVFTGEVELPD